MFKKNRNMHSSFTWQRKHLFMLSREVEGELGGGGGRLSTVFPLIFHENPASRTFVVAISRISFFGFLSSFFFSIVNYQVITNGY